MSWLTNVAQGAGVGSIFNTGFAIPGGIAGAMGVGGPGQTGQGNGNDIAGGDTSNARANQIMQAISAGKTGTYGEGQIAAANDQFKKLREEVNSGKLSQADFVKISDAVIPQVKTFINQVASSGSGGATAIRNAGGEDFLAGVGKDYDIFKSAQNLLGRDLTPQEMAQVRPRFADGTDTGNAYLAELAKADKSNPKNLGTQAQGYSPQVNDVFQGLLSRGATKDEVDYFGRMLASGEVTPYEIKSFVQATPEYQKQQDTGFRSDLSKELGNYDSTAFNREKDNILSSYSKAGLQNSSALDFAMTDALSKITQNRDQYLAGVSANQYQGNKAAAQSDYQTSLNRLFQNQDATTARSNSNLDYLTQRADQGSDYTRQMNDYMTLLNNQPRRNTGFFDYLNAGLNTANTVGNLYSSFNAPDKSYTGPNNG